MNDLKIAQQLSLDGDFDRAYAICDRHLNDDPEDIGYLLIMTYCLLAVEKTAIAYSLARRVTQLDPNEPSGWMNLGMAARDLRRDEEAERYFKRGLRQSKTDKQQSMFCVNLSSVLVDTGRFEEAEKYCLLALKLNPESSKAIANLGFCQLAQRNWTEGWANYRKCWGTEWRPRIFYNDEPEWDGKSKGTILIQGEQGLGDEISFASMLPDMIEWARNNDSEVIVECEPRLANLFRRSFPVEVHGTRRVKKVDWDIRRIDYSIPSGQIGEYFRTSDKDFPRTPYLIPDPVRSLQWKSLFELKNKPVIGVAWTGGIPKTGEKYRRVSLESLMPLFTAIDAHWVSLQYKPAGKEIEAFKSDHPEIDIVEYPWATLTQDYDDTVAMISAMDAVVGVPTAAIHAAGAIGVRNIVMCSPMKCWKFEMGNLFHPMTAMIDHSKDWENTISETASYLEDLCIEYSSASIRDSLSLTTSPNGQWPKTQANL